MIKTPLSVGFALALALLIAAGCGGGEADLVVNEIQPLSPEWLEIGNGGDSDVDVSGIGICDEDGNGDCDTAKAMFFPEGTVIPAHGHILVMTNDKAENNGVLSSDCVAGVPSCFHAIFKISAKDGEKIRLIDKEGVEIDSLSYPADATSDPGQSWSRLPDATGEASLGSSTPAAENEGL